MQTAELYKREVCFAMFRLQLLTLNETYIKPDRMVQPLLHIILKYAVIIITMLCH